MKIDESRVRKLNDKAVQSGPILYWMSRDQRIEDNWALLYAQKVATERKVPLAILFTLAPSFLQATWRAYHFMLEGLREVESSAKDLRIPFFLLSGDPVKNLSRFIKEHKVGAVITDFSPLKIARKWKEKVASALAIPLIEVDAHNVIPVWVLSQKQEYGAYTLRPKVEKLLDDYLTDFPRVKLHPFHWKKTVAKVPWDTIKKSWKEDKSEKLLWIEPGEKKARRALLRFIKKGLSSYARARNDPTLDGQSNLSPYLHFGQLSAQRCAFDVKKRGRTASSEAFLEELIVRRELADNFCLYNPDYDSTKGFPAWAKKTLLKHAKDKRPYRYTLKELEEGKSHDPLWNAAQKEMVVRGKMHGYLRMYWAKKILEWSDSPEIAMKMAITLNDRYEIDGRDSNGYAGIAWAIGGVHDRPWGERPIFGMVRYMNFDGCKRKFDVKKYIERWG